MYCFFNSKRNYHNLKINGNFHTLTFVINIFFREIIQLKRMIHETDDVFVIYYWNKLLALSLSLDHLIL